MNYIYSIYIYIYYIYIYTIIYTCMNIWWIIDLLQFISPFIWAASCHHHSVVSQVAQKLFNYCLSTGGFGPSCRSGNPWDAEIQRHPYHIGVWLLVPNGKLGQIRDGLWHCGILFWIVFFPQTCPHSGVLTVVAKAGAWSGCSLCGAAFFH